MFSMCGLLCRFLRGWRQNEAVGVMVHAATSKDSSLLVENISYTCKNSPQTVAENDAIFCQPFCAQKEEKFRQLLWRDNNKHATVISPKEKVDIEKWTGFSSPKSEDGEFESVEKEPSNESPTDCNKATSSTSRRASTCSDCENLIPFLLEASFNDSEEKSYYGYNVLVEQLAEPYAWKLTDVFAIILYTTPTKLVTLIHAFFNHALLIKKGLRIQKILTVELTGKLFTFEDPSILLESLTSEPDSKCPTTLPIEVDPPNSNTLIPTGGITSFEIMKRERLKLSHYGKSIGSLHSPSHPSLLEVQKKSSQSSEEDGSTDSDSAAQDVLRLCPRGWAVSGLKSRSSLGLKFNQRVILGQPLSLNKNHMSFFPHSSEADVAASKHFQSSLFTSVIPNPLNEFFAVKEALNKKMQREKTLKKAADNSLDSVHKKGQENCLVKSSFTNPVFQYFPQFQKSFHSRRNDVAFSPKFVRKSILFNQEFSKDTDGAKRRYSLNKDQSVITSEPKVHSHPNKVKSEADLLKATNIIKDNLANIIENYLTKSPTVVKSNIQTHQKLSKKTPEVLLLSDDKENSESILMVTVDEPNLKLNEFCKDKENNANVQVDIQENDKLITSQTDSFFLNLSPENSVAPNFVLKDRTSPLKNVTESFAHQNSVVMINSSNSNTALFTNQSSISCNEKRLSNQESNESDTAERSFSEDSLNEKVVLMEEKSCDILSPELEFDTEKENFMKSVNPEKPSQSTITNEELNISPVLPDSKYNYESKETEKEYGSKGNFNFNRELNMSVEYGFSNDLCNESSPLEDSVKSICNSISFDENSFSEDSLATNENLEYEYQNEATNIESKLEPFASTPEDFNSKTDSLDDTCKTEFPIHWHEEYVKVFSDVNQDLKGAAHSTEVISFTLEPIAEMDYLLKENTNLGEENCKIETEGPEDNFIDSSEKVSRATVAANNDQSDIISKKSVSILELDLTRNEASPTPFIEPTSLLFSELCFNKYTNHTDEINSLIEADCPENLECDNILEKCNEDLKTLATALIDTVLEEARLTLDLRSLRQDSCLKNPFLHNKEDFSYSVSADLNSKIYVPDDIGVSFRSDMENACHTFSVKNHCKEISSISRDPQDNEKSSNEISCDYRLETNEEGSELETKYLPFSDSLRNNLDYADCKSTVALTSELGEYNERDSNDKSSNIVSTQKLNLYTNNVPSESSSENVLKESFEYETNLENISGSKAIEFDFGHISLSTCESLSNIISNCNAEKSEAQGFSEVSPILRSDESFAFAQGAKAVVSPVDSAPESGFASLKDSSHSEATSESGSGVPFSKSKDSLEMTDIERDRMSGVDLLLDDFDSLSTITGDHTQTGSSPASMMSSARGSLMEEFVFNHPKGLDEIDIEKVKIPSMQANNSHYSFNSSPLLTKRGKLMNAASLDSDHRSVGYKFRDPCQDPSSNEHLNHSKLIHRHKTKVDKDENVANKENQEPSAVLTTSDSHDDVLQEDFSQPQNENDLCNIKKTEWDYGQLNNSKVFHLQKLHIDIDENCTNKEVKSPAILKADKITETFKESCFIQDKENEPFEFDKLEENKSKLFSSKSGSEESGGHSLKASDSVSSSDTIISRASFEEQGKIVNDQTLENAENYQLSFGEDGNDTVKHKGSKIQEIDKGEALILDKNIEESDYLDSLLNRYEQTSLIIGTKPCNPINDLVIYDKSNDEISKFKSAKSQSTVTSELTVIKPILRDMNSSEIKSKKPRSFEEMKRTSLVKSTKPLSKSLSGEANVFNGRILNDQNVKRRNFKSSTNSVHSLQNNEKKSKTSAYHSETDLEKNLPSDISSDNCQDNSSVSSRSNTQTSSGSGEICTDKLSLKSQDSLDKFSYFESICAQAKPRSSRRKKVLSVDVDSQREEKGESIHRSVTLPEGTFSKSKDKKKVREEKYKKKETENAEKEKKSTIQSLKGFLKRNKSKEPKDQSNKKISPSLFRKFDKKKASEISKTDEKKPIISYPSPVLPHEDGVLAESEAISSKDFNDDSANDKTHFYTSEYSNAVRDGIAKMGIKSTLHRSNALASSAYISGSESESSSVSNHSTPNSSPIAKKSNLNNSPRLYRSVLLKNISSSQESVESNGSSCKVNSPQSSPQRRPGDSPFTAAPLMGTKALLASPKSFAVTIGFQPQVESSSKSNRTMSVGENLHHMSSCRPITPCVESHNSGGNLTKRSSSMEILVYGKIREHNPSRKRSSGGCSREGSFKLHREISVETLMEIPETTSTIEERGYENYQEYLQRIKQNEDSKQNSTWSLCENEDSLSESVPIDKFSPYFCHTPHIPIQKKFSLPHNMHLKGPDEGSFSNPNLSRVGTSLSRGMPMSSSFTSSPFKRPHSSISTGVSPNKRGYANQGRNNETSPGCDDSLPASPLFEEEEDFEILKNESSINNSPPNVLIYTANNEQYYESVKNTFLNVFSDDRYAIYHLTDEIAFKSPWKLNTKLLVVCGDVATHVSTVFIRFLLSGGKVFSVCSDFLNVAVPLFAFKLPWTSSLVNSGTVEFQEAAVVSMSYNKWKNVQLLHHQHCFHSSPKHKNTKALEKKSNTGSAVSVEPTFVEITDEYGVRHRLDLKVLAKDDTWGAPSLLVANVSGNSGKALFSQVHLEQDPSKCITCELKGEQLKKSNESRLEILRHLLSTYMDIEIDSEAKERSQMNLPDYTPAYLLGRHELKQKFVEEMSKESKDGLLVRHSLSISFHNKEAQSSIPSRSFLPILLTGYTKEFSTVKYFEELNTSFIGRLVVFCEVLSSTMNVVLGKSPLEDGIAVIAIRQREGRGRYGNMWLSPLGCTMFSLQLHFSASSNMGQCLPFLQHLMSLAMVTAVTGIPGYKDIPLRLKWPNDIYLNSNTKIGGVIVEASIQGGRVIANLGCGINLSNTNPTSCINEAIREYNAATKAKLAELTYEVLCARIFNQAEYFIKRFQEKGADEIIKEYYNYWLHGNAQVTVQNELGKSQTATITGIDQFGYLKASLKTGEDILLHPDGNSFNMMEGLIYHKKTKS